MFAVGDDDAGEAEVDACGEGSGGESQAGDVPRGCSCLGGRMFGRRWGKDTHVRNGVLRNGFCAIWTRAT